MDLKAEVYSPALELLGMLEIHRSVIWEEKAFSAGSFSLEALLSEESRHLMEPENIIWIEGGTAGIIEYIQQKADESGPYISVKGRLLTGILDRRILWGRYDLRGAVPDIMRGLVEDCAVNPTRGDDTAKRKIEGLVLEQGVSAGSETIRIQKTGGSLLECLEELGETYQVAFGIRFNPEIPQMEFWARPGEDRSIHQADREPVFYSTELDDVLSSEYAYDSGGYKNTALVAGEGEGDSRTSIFVNADSSAGLSRRELYVDARDLQSDSDPDNPLTPEEYTAVLTARGKSKLAENRLVQSFEAVVRSYHATYDYGADYQNGDTITVIDDRLGVTVDAVVHGAERSVGEHGETLTLNLGYGQPTLYDILKRKAVK